MGTINFENVHNTEHNQNVDYSGNIWEQIENAQKIVLQRFPKDSLAQNCALKGLERIVEDMPLEPISAVIERKDSCYYHFQIPPEMTPFFHSSEINLQVRNFNANIGDCVTVYKCLDSKGYVVIKFRKNTFESFWRLVELVDKTEKLIQNKFPDNKSIARINALKTLSKIVDCDWSFEDKIMEIESTFPFK